MSGRGSELEWGDGVVGQVELWREKVLCGQPDACASLLWLFVSETQGGAARVQGHTESETQVHRKANRKGKGPSCCFEYKLFWFAKGASTDQSPQSIH